MKNQEARATDNQLSDRKKLILKTVVEAHIGNGEPVGSKFLAENKQIACSSATIRNEMAELENLGYLEQPHLSSGRVPSEKGYRFYVDTLMQQYDMTAGEISKLNEILGAKHAEADTILEHATRVMSRMTNYTALTLKQKPRGAVVNRFDTMYIDDSSFALIMLTSAGNIKTKRIRVGSNNLHHDTVKTIGEALNSTLIGVAPDDINIRLIVELENKLAGLEALVNPLVKIIYDSLANEGPGELKYEGVNKLLEYPEFSNTEKLKHLLQAFDNKSGMLDMVSNALGDDTSIIIGSENPMNEMNDSSMIFQTIRIGGKPIGAIGLIGPRRMDYARVCAVIKYIAKALEGSFDTGLLPSSNDESK